MNHIRSWGFTVALAGCAMFAQQADAQIVTPSNPQGWTGFTYYGPTGTDPGTGASAGITTTYPQSGNGSAQIKLADALNSEADWAITFGGGANYSLSGLSALSYDWFRSSSSTANGIIAPAFALQLTDGEFLVYEYAYNHVGNPGADTWTTENVLNGTWWFTGNGAGVCDRYGAFQSLSYFDAQCYGGNGRFNGIDMFMGYAYAGTFDGAVDNVVIDVPGRTGLSTTWNFEADATNVVPEPASFVLVAAGLAGIVAARRRKRVR